MRHVVASACLVAVLLVSVPAAHAPAEVRALWVVRTTLASRSGVAAMIAAARDSGFNTLLVQVRGRGDAYYRSRVEPRADALAGQPSDFDPLGAVLAEAKAAGLAVHAWVNVNLVADAADLPSSSRHVVRRHPDWLMVPRDLAAPLRRLSPRDPKYLARLASWTRGESSSVEGLFLSPASSGAADHTARVVEDLVSHYAVDGVHFDYARYPGEQFDFRRETLDAFTADVLHALSKRERTTLRDALQRNPAAVVERYPARWEAFRRARLTALMQRLRSVVRSKRPHAIVSAAVFPDVDTARGSRGQDWPAWIGQGVLDAACPMIYTTDRESFTRQVTAGRAAAAGRPLWAGIGAYRLSVAQTIEHIGLARGAGADGVVLFSYDSPAASERGADVLARIGRDAFGR
jgi:uncharacterized lipoprotein YddW (UPF0748 family)